MLYVSTRGSAPALDFEGVTLAGLASDGGLYVPSEWPRFTEAEIEVTDGTTKRLYEFGVFDDRRLLGSMRATTGTTTVGPYTASGARLLYKSELPIHVIGQGTGSLGVLETMPAQAADSVDTEAASARFRSAAEARD